MPENYSNFKVFCTCIISCGIRAARKELAKPRDLNLTNIIIIPVIYQRWFVYSLDVSSQRFGELDSYLVLNQMF